MGVYNCERYLDQAIQSILDQTMEEWELIIVDDGSSDDTGHIIDKYGDQRIRALHQTRTGLTTALIRAETVARGVYLARQDADDVSAPGRLRAQLDYLESRPDVALLGSRASIIDEEGGKIGELSVETEPSRIRSMLGDENQFVHGSVMLRRDVYNEVGGYRQAFRYSQDYDLVLRIEERAKVANLDSNYYARRYTRDMISIRCNASQSAYRNLAKVFRKERLKNGYDRLEAGRHVPELDRIETEKEGQGADGYYEAGYVYACLRQGELKKARRVIVERIKTNPAQGKLYIQYLVTFLNRAFVVRMLSFWDMWSLRRGRQVDE